MISRDAFIDATKEINKIAIEIVFFILACRKMVGLNLNETQLILGLLLVVCATMLMIVVGMLVEILGRLSDSGDSV